MNRPKREKPGFSARHSALVLLTVNHPHREKPGTGCAFPSTAKLEKTEKVLCERNALPVPAVFPPTKPHDRRKHPFKAF